MNQPFFCIPEEHMQSWDYLLALTESIWSAYLGAVSVALGETDENSEDPHVKKVLYELFFSKVLIYFNKF